MPSFKYPVIIFSGRFPSIICHVQPGSAQPVDGTFHNVFEFYVVADQHAATGLKIGLEFEKIFNGSLSLSYLPNRPKVAAFISGSQKSRGVLKFIVSR